MGGCEGVPKHPVKVWQDGYGLKLCPHTAYWNALTKAMDGNLDDFICRPSFNGGAKGILPHGMEQGNNEMIAEQCKEYFAQYMIQENMMEFASGKQISCVVKMCDMGSTTLQETTVLYSVRQLPVNGLDAR